MGPKKLPEATAQGKTVEGPFGAQGHDVYKASRISAGALLRAVLLGGAFLHSKLPRRVSRKRSGCIRRPQHKEGLWTPFSKGPLCSQRARLALHRALLSKPLGEGNPLWCQGTQGLGPIHDGIHHLRGAPTPPATSHSLTPLLSSLLTLLTLLSV